MCIYDCWSEKKNRWKLCSKEFKKISKAFKFELHFAKALEQEQVMKASRYVFYDCLTISKNFKKISFPNSFKLILSVCIL